MNIADFNPLVREAYLETLRRTLTWDIGHSKAIGEIDLKDRIMKAKKCKMCS